MAFLLYCGLFYGLFVASVYKNSASMVLSDKVLTIAGSIGSFCNGSSRFIWASAMDYFGFKKVYTVIMIMQLVACSTIYQARYNGDIYIGVVAMSFLCEGGHFSLFPAVCMKVFGTKSGGQICSILFWGAALSALSSFVITQVSKEINYQLVYQIALALTVVNCASLFFMSEEPMQKNSGEKAVAVVAASPTRNSNTI
jgi:OFA family oxalate/formate antiporter-like MFS transporter